MPAFSLNEIPNTMKILLFCFVCLLLSTAGFAQSSSGIFIQTVDEDGEPLINWPVFVYQGGREVSRVYTDDDGGALVKPLSPATYDLRIEKDGWVKRISKVTVGVGEMAEVTIDLRSGLEKPPHTICYLPFSLWPKPIVYTSGNSTITDQQLEAMPVW